MARILLCAVGGLFLLVLAADPALGQGAALPAPAGGSEIVVRHGRPEDATPAEIHRQARTITPSDDQLHIPLARFEDRLCPGIIGLQEQAAMQMIDRIRDVAHSLGIRLHEDGCTANLVVIFSTDSQATLQSMVDRNPQVFQFVSAPDIRRMLAPGPVHVFTQIEPRTRDGMPVSQVRDLTRPPVTYQAMAHSQIYTPTRRDIVSATVIFDRDHVAGMSLLQLADYTVMRALAQTQPPTGEQPLVSILSLFNPTPPYPESLTDFDRAYLRALYDWIPNLPAAAKLGNVSAELDRLLRERAAKAAAAPQMP